MKRILILALLMFTSLAMTEVKHAPTKEQCRADLAVWSDDIISFCTTCDDHFNNCFPGVYNRKTSCIRAGPQAKYSDVNEEMLEMLACDKVDPGYQPQPGEAVYTYRGLTQPLQLEMSYRLRHFLVRHDLWKQFYASLSPEQIKHHWEVTHKAGEQFSDEQAGDLYGSTFTQVTDMFWFIAETNMKNQQEKDVLAKHGRHEEFVAEDAAGKR
jgi:hypothetical protein